jgi:hypothetical protein
MKSALFTTMFERTHMKVEEHICISWSCHVTSIFQASGNVLRECRVHRAPRAGPMSGQHQSHANGISRTFGFSVMNV